jgi:hypothetical protein
LCDQYDYTTVEDFRVDRQSECGASLLSYPLQLLLSPIPQCFIPIILSPIAQQLKCLRVGGGLAKQGFNGLLVLSEAIG